MTSEPVNNPQAERSGIAEAVSAALRRPAFSAVLLVLAATVVVLVGMRLAAPVLNPILFAVVLTLLFNPIYAWLKRRGSLTPVALVIMLVGLTILFSANFYVLGASISRFSSGIGSYATELNEQLASIQALIGRTGLSNVDVGDVVEPSALAGAVGVVLSGIAGFLSNLFPYLDDHAVLARRGSRHDEQAKGEREQGSPAGRAADNGRPERGAPVRAARRAQPRYSLRRHHLVVRLGGGLSPDVGHPDLLS
ncbi:MAG: AI-2E family transporter, partial [Rubrobacter sp.]